MVFPQRSRINTLFSYSILTRVQTLISHVQRLSHTFAGERKVRKSPRPRSNESASLEYAAKDDHLQTSNWVVIDSRKVGVDWSMISPSTQMVLKILRRKGFDAYLVGGCVRDLLLKKTPKDFDVVTTAELKQIKKEFNRCQIVGRQFPICLVKIFENTIEVSSFDTVAKHSIKDKKNAFCQVPDGCDNKDFFRWKNCIERDFTINSLLYDPFLNRIYDYTGGIKDLKMSKLRTVVPAHVSFKKDCARILRAMRIAARLGFQFCKDIASALRVLYSSILNLNKERLIMELNFMLAYGSAESSLYLLRRYKLLDVLLPVHGAYLTEAAKKGSDQIPTMFMKLFSCMDKLLAPDRPSDRNLWAGLLAFHLTLITHPQDSLVIWTFASILHYGEWHKAVEVAREKMKMRVHFFPELLKVSSNRSDESLVKDVSGFASLVISSMDALICREALLNTMAVRYPSAPHTELVFMSKKVGKDVSILFSVLEADARRTLTKRENFDFDHKLLKAGEPEETRFVLGKVIMDAMNSRISQEQDMGGCKAIASEPSSPLSKLFL